MEIIKPQKYRVLKIKEEQHKQLKFMALALGTTMQEVVYNIIERHLKQSNPVR